jgi:hypothetical protein
MKTNQKLETATVFIMAVCATAALADDTAGSGNTAAGRCTTVQANQDWQGTGITVSPGEFVCVAASGLWSHGGQGIQAITPFYGPEGFAKDSPVTIPEVVSRTGALVGRIGGNAPFVVGQRLCFIPSAPGELMLSMNDLPATFDNNLGAMHVQVVTWASASIPERIDMQPQQCRENRGAKKGRER